MSGFSIDIDDAQLTAALRGLTTRLRDLRPVMAGIGQELVTLADLSFRGEQDPWGKPWDALSEVTLLRRGQRKTGGKSLRTKRGNTRASALRAMLSAKILRDTGRLAGSVNYRASRDQVVVGSNVIYAATQQFGRADNRMFGRALAPIPARPFLPIRNGRLDLPAATRAALLDLLHDALAQAAQ
ncbi:phage virion morphogenesis protein [uncultured Lamprocystis sp.]|jgi:phage virion morphogenesis protein|uniref:phage virion morphogenesis protein n=1 Tax=uncultured Lamprocystis sp. TaxID=543132 RepID=UPI0025CE1E6D|nr:phage virion morphogenesis protein [uncultured Lamprocystis sp.]